jgi:hypothetical protein
VKERRGSIFSLHKDKAREIKENVVVLVLHKFPVYFAFRNGEGAFKNFIFIPFFPSRPLVITCALK